MLNLRECKLPILREWPVTPPSHPVPVHVALQLAEVEELKIQLKRREAEMGNSEQWKENPSCLGYIGINTLPETNSLPLKMDGWNTSLSYWGGLFSGAFAVSFREGIPPSYMGIIPTQVCSFLSQQRLFPSNILSRSLVSGA